MTIDEQLAEDRRLYGSSFEHVTRDGKRTRLDPSTVRLKTQVDDVVELAVKTTVDRCARKAAEMIVGYSVAALIVGVCIGSFIG